MYIPSTCNRLHSCIGIRRRYGGDNRKSGETQKTKTSVKAKEEEDKSKAFLTGKAGIKIV